MNWVAVGLGAALGAWLRWGLGLWLNSLSVQLPLGTLVANWIGAYSIGVAVGVFDSHSSMSPELRLFIVTGFLGGLTTFSSFSAEAMTLLQRGDYLWALGHSLLHWVGSVVLCIAGFVSYKIMFE